MSLFVWFRCREGGEGVGDGLPVCVSLYTWGLLSHLRVDQKQVSLHPLHRRSSTVYGT